MWPALTLQNTTNPRPWLPTTDLSILHQSADRSTIYKAYIYVRASNLFTPNGSQYEDPLFCNMTDGKPCLFEVVTDPSESTNLVSSNPELYQTMVAKLQTYTPYVDGTMTNAELVPYNCTPERWGLFYGPCCVHTK